MPSPPSPDFAFYTAGVDVGWVNSLGNPIKIVKMVFTNGVSFKTVQRNIPSFLSVSETTYKDSPEYWIDKSSFFVAFLKNVFGPVPTSVDVSVIDFNGAESAATTFPVTVVGSVFNAAGDTIHDDGSFDRLEAGIDAVATQINVYNQNFPANRDHSSDPNSEDAFAVNDCLLIDSEQMEISAIVNASTGLYTVLRAQGGTTATAHSAGAVVERIGTGGC